MVEYIGLIFLPLYVLLVLILGASITAGLFAFHVAVVPLIFRYSKTFRRNLVFANFVQWPLNIDFDDPSASGIEGARNLSIEYFSKVDNCPVKLGIWHILPRTVYERLKGNFNNNNIDRDELNLILEDELANSKKPVMIYCHGNSNSRAANHRIELYKFFQKMDFHTIAFDYRGFGDSTNLHPCEAGVVEDSLVVYEWLHDTALRSTDTAVYVWGHSLGTGITSHLLGNLKELSINLLDRSKPLPLPNGLILESPFNNLADEVANIPVSKLVTWLPYYESSFVEPFRAHPEQRFRSDAHLSRARALPVLILHARDDAIVPFVCGLKLYRSVLASRKDGGATIRLHVYEKNEKLGHTWICHANDLAEVVGKFVNEHL